MTWISLIRIGYKRTFRSTRALSRTLNQLNTKLYTTGQRHQIPTQRTTLRPIGSPNRAAGFAPKCTV
eukprot:767444-Hanusia_phi.AAC.1